MENKKYNGTEFSEEFLTFYKENGGTKTAKELRERTVGNNGYSLGQEFHLTGVIKKATAKVDGKPNPYIALETAEGVDLSLQALMGISSLKGYDLSDAEHNHQTGKTEAKKVTEKRKSNLIAGFEFEQVWTPPTRNLLDLADMIATGECDLTDKVATFLGTAVKPIIAKKDSTAVSIEDFRAGYERVIETRLWSVE